MLHHVVASPRECCFWTRKTLLCCGQFGLVGTHRLTTMLPWPQNWGFGVFETAISAPCQPENGENRSFLDCFRSISNVRLASPHSGGPCQLIFAPLWTTARKKQRQAAVSTPHNYRKTRTAIACTHHSFQNPVAPSAQGQRGGQITISCAVYILYIIRLLFSSGVYIILSTIILMNFVLYNNADFFLLCPSRVKKQNCLI